MVKSSSLASVALLAAGIAGIPVGSTFAQTPGAKTWPTRVVRIVLPGSPGAGSDIIGRVLAPAGTSRDIVTKLHAEIVGALKLPDVQKRFFDLGTDIIGNSPEEFSAQIRDGREKWAKVARDAGIKPE